MVKAAPQANSRADMSRSAKMHGVHVTPYLRQRIMDDKDAGLSPSAIARRYNVNPKTIYRWINRESTDELEGRGRPTTVLTTRTLNAMTELANAPKPPIDTEHFISLLRQKKVKIGERSFRRGCRKLGLSFQKNPKAPPGQFKPATQEKRLEYCEQHVDLDKVTWLFMDQSAAVAKHAGTCITFKGKAPIVPIPDRSEGKLHFMGVIGAQFKSPLMFLPTLQETREAVKQKNAPRVKRNNVRRAKARRAKTQRAKKKILNDIETYEVAAQETWDHENIIKMLKPCLSELKKATAVVIDNAGAHSGVKEWLLKNKVKLVPHPPTSPDLNAIETVWGVVKQKAKRAMYNADKIDIPTLKVEITKAWDSLTLPQLKPHAKRIDRTMKECIDAKGGPTRN
jgi:transposase